MQMTCSRVIITIAAMRLARQLELSIAEAYSQVTAANCQGRAEKGKPAITVIKAAIGTTVTCCSLSLSLSSTSYA